MASVTSFHVGLLIHGPQVEQRINFRMNRCQWSQRRLVLTACAPDDAIRANHESSAALKETLVPSKVSLSLFKLPTVGKLRQIVSGAPSFMLAVRRQPGADFLLGFLVATGCLIVGARMYVANRLSSNDRLGTVDDLVRRGQLRSERRGICEPLKYDDPFSNPLVKVGQGNSSVEMCGKVYKLAPVTLTEEQRSIHQKRRSRAYEWKRPKVFLNEGDAIPADVDPDTIRWIPANHPFATTASDIDADLAQKNVYQKHGVPFRIQEEHEAMQKKLEALQSGEKVDRLQHKDFERAVASRPPSKPDEEGNTN